LGKLERTGDEAIVAHFKVIFTRSPG